MAPLVDYSDSADEADELHEPQPAPKRRKLSLNKAVPTLPASFFSLYATNVRTAAEDDPSLHGGRVRQVAHKEGNWPTHIYLEWYPQERHEKDIDFMIKSAQQADANVHSFLRSNLGVQLPLHISLSAPLVLETEQKDAFQQAVKDAIRDPGVRSFIVSPVSVDWVPNSDKSRYFLVLKLTRPPNNDLNKLLRACNACARRYKLQELYQAAEPELSPNLETRTTESKDNPFHISIAWTLYKPSVSATDALKQALPAELTEASIAFDTVKLKIGNVVYDLPLLADVGG